LYLGYKLLWAIRLLLNGRTFPHGTIHLKRWKSYVVELALGLTKPDILIELLKIDAEAVFQILSIWFYKGKVFEFIE
jgi:hypothetical protein